MVYGKVWYGMAWYGAGNRHEKLEMFHVILDLSSPIHCTYNLI